MFTKKHAEQNKNAKSVAELIVESSSVEYAEFYPEREAWDRFMDWAVDELMARVPGLSEQRAFAHISRAARRKRNR